MKERKFDLSVTSKTGQQLENPEVGIGNFFETLYKNQEEFNKDILTQKVKSLPTSEVYKQGLWDKKNIFQLFGSMYYDLKVPVTYHKLVIRLFEFREHCKPVENIEALNADWLIGFFQFLATTGQYSINTVNFDPLNYDAKRFFLDKPRQPYKPKSLNKLIGIAKTIVAGQDSEFSFYKRGHIPKLDLSELRLSKVTDQKDKEGTRIEHNLSKEELDMLYWFQFDPKKLKQYQEIFDKINKSKGVHISVGDLDTARKLFILQTTFGGLRGYKELSTAKIRKHSTKDYKVTFFQNKVSETVENPLNAYSIGILKPLNFIIPVLKRENAQKKGVPASLKMMEGHYRSLLQTVGHIINFDREVIVDATTHQYETIKNLFNPYFSRKTFGTLLYKMKVAESDIELFTGHKPRNASELSSSYIQKNTIENKIEIIKVLKVGANPYK